MTTLFISDLHLVDSRPESTVAFEQLVSAEARQCNALYILGDLFEAWLGDDMPGETGTRVQTALNELGRSGVDIFFQHGNRDFLVGERYAQRCNMTLLPE